MQDWPFASNDDINRWATVFLLFLLFRGIGLWWLGRRLQDNLRLLRIILPITALATGLFWAYAIYSFNPRIFPGGEMMVDTSNRQVLLAAILAAPDRDALLHWLREQPLVRTHTLAGERLLICLLYTSPSPRDATLSRMPSSA